MKKAILSVFVTIFSLCNFVIFASATDEISPCFNNISHTMTTFAISETGETSTEVGYMGLLNITTGAKITTTLQKAIGDDEWEDIIIWTDEVSGRRFSTTHTYSLAEHATYRIVAEYAIYGSGGEADVITDTIEKIY